MAVAFPVSLQLCRLTFNTAHLGQAGRRRSGCCPHCTRDGAVRINHGEDELPEPLTPVASFALNFFFFGLVSLTVPVATVSAACRRRRMSHRWRGNTGRRKSGRRRYRRFARRVCLCFARQAGVGGLAGLNEVAPDARQVGARASGVMQADGCVSNAPMSLPSRRRRWRHRDHRRDAADRAGRCRWPARRWCRVCRYRGPGCRTTMRWSGSARRCPASGRVELRVRVDLVAGCGQQTGAASLLRL